MTCTRLIDENPGTHSVRDFSVVNLVAHSAANPTTKRSVADLAGACTASTAQTKHANNTDDERTSRQPQRCAWTRALRGALFGTICLWGFVILNTPLSTPLSAGADDEDLGEPTAQTPASAPNRKRAAPARQGAHKRGRLSSAANGEDAEDVAGDIAGAAAAAVPTPTYPFDSLAGAATNAMPGLQEARAADMQTAPDAPSSDDDIVGHPSDSMHSLPSTTAAAHTLASPTNSSDVSAFSEISDRSTTATSTESAHSSSDGTVATMRAHGWDQHGVSAFSSPTQTDSEGATDDLPPPLIPISPTSSPSRGVALVPFTGSAGEAAVTVSSTTEGLGLATDDLPPPLIPISPTSSPSRGVALGPFTGSAGEAAVTVSSTLSYPISTHDGASGGAAATSAVSIPPIAAPKATSRVADPGTVLQITHGKKTVEVSTHTPLAELKKILRLPVAPSATSLLTGLSIVFNRQGPGVGALLNVVLQQDVFKHCPTIWLEFTPPRGPDGTTAFPMTAELFQTLRDLKLQPPQSAMGIRFLSCAFVKAEHFCDLFGLLYNGTLQDLVFHLCTFPKEGIPHPEDAEKIRRAGEAAQCARQSSLGGTPSAQGLGAYTVTLQGGTLKLGDLCAGMISSFVAQAPRLHLKALKLTDPAGLSVFKLASLASLLRRDLSISGCIWDSNMTRALSLPAFRQATHPQHTLEIRGLTRHANANIITNIDSRPPDLFFFPLLTGLVSKLPQLRKLVLNPLPPCFLNTSLWSAGLQTQAHNLQTLEVGLNFPLDQPEPDYLYHFFSALPNLPALQEVTLALPEPVLSPTSRQGVNILWHALESHIGRSKSETTSFPQKTTFFTKTNTMTLVTPSPCVAQTLSALKHQGITNVPTGHIFLGRQPVNCPDACWHVLPADQAILAHNHPLISLCTQKDLLPQQSAPPGGAAGPAAATLATTTDEDTAGL